MGSTTPMTTATSSLQTWFTTVQSVVNDFITDILLHYMPYLLALVALAVIVSFAVYILIRLLRPGGKK